MIKTISNRFILSLSVLISVSTLMADGHDTLVVTWTGTPGEWKTLLWLILLLMVHKLMMYTCLSQIKYTYSNPLITEFSCHVIGASYADGERPAEIQPILGADGESQFNAYWPAGSIKTYGDDQILQTCKLAI